MPAIRDPVHKWIKTSTEEQAIIDSPLFQRLHWVSQLSSVKQVFPGGVHTRFLHSLGVMKLSGKYMEQLFQDFPKVLSKLVVSTSSNTESYYIQLARLAGLLHDIGHGPFSHAFDRAIYQKIYGVEDGGHDIHRLKIVKSDLLRDLIINCGVKVDDLIAVWNSNTDEYKQLHEFSQNMVDIIRTIVQGPLGADRMDFTLRDSYFTGTGHLGTIAARRIISNSSLKWINHRLCLHYHSKCLSDIIQALAGRYYMYDSVYLHKTVDAANLLIEEMLDKSINNLNIIERTLDLEKFQYLNDYTIIGEIMSYNDELENNKDKNKQHKSDATQVYSNATQVYSNAKQAKITCNRLLQRRLPKTRREKIIEVGINTTKFNPDKYLDKVSKKLKIPKDKLFLKKTRTIYGIDSDKFNQHNIYFWDSTKNKSISCKKALQKAKYTQPRNPHYLVRIYER